MEFLAHLWLPILVSAVAVFLASSVIHMATPMHKRDMSKIDDESAVLETLRAHDVRPGEYMFPCAESMKDLGTPEMIAKYEQGPVGFLTVLPPGPPTMGKSLVQWFVFSVVVGVFVAYAAWLVLPAGSDYGAVFRLTGTIAVLAYATSAVPNSIWKGTSWGTALRFIVDGFVYGLVTAGVFGWLWP